MKNLAYIYTLEQFIDEWVPEAALPMTNTLECFDSKQKLTNLQPPATKDLIFKWVFQIPDLHIDQNERDSFRHLITLFHPFTGKLTQLSYQDTPIRMGEPPRNKFLTLMNYYRAVVDYIEANIFLISLQI